MANVDRSGLFGRFSGISEARDTILTRFGSHFQVFGLEPTGNLGIRSNQGQKWIQHPQNRGIPCCQPLGPKGPLAAPGGRGPESTPTRRPDADQCLPPGPARGPFGQQKWVPRADNMVSLYFEGAESISGLGSPPSQPFRGVLG